MMRREWENSLTRKVLARLWSKMQPALSGVAGWLWKAAGNSLLLGGTAALARQRLYPLVATSLLFRAMRWLVLDLAKEG